MSRTSVVLVNYHGAVDTHKCIKSLLSCRDQPQIVVVDNTPNDQALLVALAPYPEVRIICTSENLGFGGGNNIGINWAMAQTNCEFIFILNNDTTVQFDTIASLEAALDCHSEAGIATPRIVFMDNPNVLWYGGGEISWLRGSVITPGFLGAIDAPLAMQSRAVSFASGCALLVRRNVMQQLRGFDTRFFMYEEDVEFCLRATEIGYGLWYEACAVVEHVSGGASRSGEGFSGMLWSSNPNLPFYAFHIFRNRLLNMRLHARGFDRLVFVIGFTLLLIKKLCLFSLAGRWDGNSAIIKGWLSYREIIKGTWHDDS